MLHHRTEEAMRLLHVLMLMLAGSICVHAQSAGLIANRLQLNGELLLGLAAHAGSVGQLLVSQGAGTTPAWTGLLFWDNASSRLGIGTATPAATVDVVGTVRVTGLQLPTGAAAGYILQSDATGNATWTNPAGLVTVTASNGLTRVGNDIRLGGSLTANTDIALGGNILSFSGAATSVVAVGTSTPPASTARLYVTSASNAYDAIRAVHTSSSITTAYAALGGQLSGSGYLAVTGYLGYHATNNKTFGVRTLGGDYGAWFDKPIAVMPSTTAPSTTADVEVRNTMSGSPVSLLFRQTASNAAAGATLVTLDFGDNFQTGAQAQFRILRGAAGSSGSLPTDVVILTTSAGSTTPVERVRIAHSGFIGVGVSVPQALLHQDAVGGSYHKFTAAAATGTTATDGLDIGVTSDGAAEIRQRENAELRFYTGDQLRMRLLPTGELVLLHQLIAQSSRQFKEAIRPIEQPVQILQQLQGVRFRWKSRHGGTEDLGFIAEDVVQILPEIVRRDAEGNVVGMDYTRLIAVLVEAVKEQAARLQSLEQEIKHLLRAR
ncbi:MAG: tail fiber domain-containing protein [Bacteroidota bacterium]|nr:tail fiber domain-containing protein [Bacteroidota bacterium]